MALAGARVLNADAMEYAPYGIAVYARSTFAGPEELELSCERIWIRIAALSPRW